MKRADYKKYDELSAQDLDKGCRRFINQGSPANRKLKKKLRRQARKKLKGSYDNERIHQEL